MSDTSICMILRTLHLNIPYTSLFIVFFGTKFLVIATFILSVIIFILYFLFNGCIYTMLEYKFSKDNWLLQSSFGNIWL